MRSYIFIFCFLLLSCTAQKDLSTVKKYLNASDVSEKGAYMSESYLSWFNEKKGEGEDKKSALTSFQQWDSPLHPDVDILKHKHHGNEWELQVLEQNDFSKMIDFPGWKATVLLKMDHHQISELIYIPDTLNPNYKKWLNPAVEWLQQNKPHELENVYKNGRLVRSEATALEWVRLLKEWKASTAAGKTIDHSLYAVKGTNLLLMK